MRLSIKELKSQTQAYIRAVFAETLKKEGFVSYKNEDICWFRFPTDDIIQSVLFSTEFKRTPIALTMYYGSFPWFSDLGIPNNVHAYGGEAGNRLMKQAFLFGGTGTKEAFDPENEIYVFCSKNNQFGFQILTDEILPYLQECSDLKSSYERHKKDYFTMYEINERETPGGKYYQPKPPNIHSIRVTLSECPEAPTPELAETWAAYKEVLAGNLKPYFELMEKQHEKYRLIHRPMTPNFDLMHEVVYNNDLSMYSECQRLIEKCMEWKPTPEKAEFCAAFNEVLAGNREPYLALLDKKKELMIEKLKRGRLI